MSRASSGAWPFLACPQYYQRCVERTVHPGPGTVQLRAIETLDLVEVVEADGHINDVTGGIATNGDWFTELGDGEKVIESRVR